MWRKTRSNPSGYNLYSSCIGADPNRNFGYKWGGQGASKNPCSETYRGPYAFSERETAAIRNFLTRKEFEDQFQVCWWQDSYYQWSTSEYLFQLEYLLVFARFGKVRSGKGWTPLVMTVSWPSGSKIKMLKNSIYFIKTHGRFEKFLSKFKEHWKSQLWLVHWIRNYVTLPVFLFSFSWHFTVMVNLFCTLGATELLNPKITPN